MTTSISPTSNRIFKIINPQLLSRNVLGMDGYKGDHRRQYPDGTEIVFANYTARYSRRAESDGHTIFFGLQPFILDTLVKDWKENFFDQKKEDVLHLFSLIINHYLPDNEIGTEHIAALHDLGYLPIAIMSLPEGSKVPLRIPSLVIWNTKPEFFWLTNYLETILSTNLWLMCNSATTAHQFKQKLDYYAKLTTGSTDFVKFQGHDFSFRGMAGVEAAIMSGASHLAAGFVGTDTIPAIPYLMEFYGADIENELIGCSVPATEHSVMCAGGEDDEEETIRRLITKIYPKGIRAVVADTWDYWNTITVIARNLKKEIMASPGKLVFRPDSGDPVRIVCGYSYCEVDSVEELPDDDYGYEYAVCGEKIFKYCGKRVNLDERWDDVTGKITLNELKGSIQCLWDIFGGTTNELGFKELDPHIGLIYGDSITLQRADAICRGLIAKGFATTNIVFGIGSYTYQYATRDTDGYAIKGTWVQIKGIPKPIFKNPKTDNGTKKSARGLLAVYKEGDTYRLKEDATWEEVCNCDYQLRFLDGVAHNLCKLSEVRALIDTHK